MNLAACRFPLSFALMLSALVGGVYFIPQALYYQQMRAPHILLEENFDETAYAVWTSRAAGEHVGQPDPYQLASDGVPPISFATVQPFPAFALATFARLLRVPVTVVFWLGSFLFPALCALLFIGIGWLCGLRERKQLALLMCLSLLMYPPIHWPAQWRYVSAIYADQTPGFRLTLPLSRRFQPQFTALIHYATILLSLLLLKSPTARRRWAFCLAAGVAFGISFYCYFFSWSLLLGWFVLGGLCVWRWRRECLKLWCVAAVIGLLIATPYFVSLIRHFGEIGASAASTHTRRVAVDTTLAVTVIVCVLLWFALRRESAKRELLWTPLALNSAAVIGALQNAVTGIYVQPYHYLHYFARPTTNFALVALLVVWQERFAAEKRQPRLWQMVMLSLIVVCVLSAAATQLARYKEVLPEARTVLAAAPALQFLQHHTAPGALVYCPQPSVREAVPLYTNAVPFFSLYLLLHETAQTREALQERIAATEVLRGRSAEEFAAWLQARPIEAYLQHRQRTIDANNSAQLDKVTAQLRDKFNAVLQKGRTTSLASLRYALLPAEVKLETTRLPQYFVCRQLWADARYAVFALDAR